MSERVTGRGERRQGPAGIQPRAKQTLTTRFDFGPKFSITPVAPLKIHIHFFVHCTILRRCNGITAASSWSVTVTSLQNTGADADQNCVGLHAPAIPFPTYRKKVSVCFLKLCNAQRRYLKRKLATHRARFRRIIGRRRLRFRRVSPLIHHFYTSCTRQSPSIHGGCSAPPQRRRARPKKGAY